MSLLLCAVFGLLFPACASANFIVNGSFETGDFTGWTQFGNTGYSEVTGSFVGFDPTDGNDQAYFGPIGSPGGIIQTVSSDDEDYDVSFDLADDGGTPSYFDVSLGDDSVFSLTDADEFDYTHYSFTVAGVGPDPVLSFTFQQDPTFFLLDNVSVTPTPEPGAFGLFIVTLPLLAGAGGRVRRSFRRWPVLGFRGAD